MAVKGRSSGAWSSRIHFLIRFLGLTGFLAFGAGLFLAVNAKLWTLPLADWMETGRISKQDFVNQGEKLKVAMLLSQDPWEQAASWGIVAGAASFFLFLAVEAVVLLRTTTGRRSASRINSALQFVLAAVLLVGVNIFAFHHWQVLDWTRSRAFTLPESLQKELRALDKKTTIVVYKTHKTFGMLNDKPDEYDFEAERKVVEKVRDLVEELRPFGPQFNVIELDVEEKRFDQKRQDLRTQYPELGPALDGAAENSIFFYSKTEGNPAQVQRLSFSQFYQLDKTASKTPIEEDRNLVLRYQGLSAFTHRLLNIDNRKPTIGLAVIHELLTSQGGEEFYTLAGVRKTLIEQGFNVEDIVLKKWSEFGPPEADVATFEEYKLEDLTEQLSTLDAAIASMDQQIKKMGDLKKHLETATLEELTKEFARQLKGRKFTEEIRQDNVEDIQQQLTYLQALLPRFKEERTQTAADKARLRQDASGEQRRLTDLKAKFDRLLARCDLLIVPRMTLRNVALGEVIRPSLHNLDKAQADAIRDFMKSGKPNEGKPVLACLGPISEPPAGAMMTPDQRSPDAFEDLLTQLGFRLNKQTILYTDEAKSFAQRKSGFLTAGGNVQIPPVRFDWPPHKGKKANPIRESLLIAESSLGQSMDLSIRSPRPVFFDEEVARNLPYEPEFIMTSERTWNDDNPFPSRERTPAPEMTQRGDPLFGTPDAKRYGPFPIGAAVEARVPTAWYADGGSQDKTVRVAVIGQGHWFVGSELKPAQQRLLLDCVNWLLRRDEELLHEGKAWSYPRTHLSERDQKLWRWGMQAGLPALFGYLGLVVWMVRRLR